MNRRDILRRLPAVVVAAIATDRLRSSASAGAMVSSKAPTAQFDVFLDDGWWDIGTTRINGVTTTTVAFEPTRIPLPNMTPGVPYCPTCDADRWLPERMAPGHISTRFGRDRLDYDVYLNGEKINDAFEVMDGQWALRSDLRDFHAATCPRCRRALMQTLSLGPYDVRKADS